MLQLKEVQSSFTVRSSADRDQTMLGTIVNSLAIIGGSLVGLLFNKGIAQRYKDILMSAIGLSVVLIGLKSALATDDLMVVIFSMILGSLAGEALAIENRLEGFGKFLEKKMASASGDTSAIGRGFVTASLVFCVGSMAIVGSLESGLTGNHQTLLAKSVLDGVTSIVFASAMGIGVIFSSVAVFLYQGLITISAGFLKNYLTPDTVAQMTSVGGLLILAIGLNMLKITSLKIGNMLPAIFLPLFYFMIRSVI